MRRSTHVLFLSGVVLMSTSLVGEAGPIQATLTESLSGLWNLIANSDAEKIKSLAATHIWASILICFVSGILTSLTPCVYPMIPITISIFGRAAQESTGSSTSRQLFNRHTFFLSGIYVAGMSVTYSVMGLVAGLTGSLFGKIMQSPFMMGFLILLFLALALGQLGVFKLALPASWQGRLATIGSADNKFGIFMMGLVSGLIVSPCVGPVIAGILAFVFESSNALKGFIFFFCFSLGLGLLFLLIGGFSGALSTLPRSGPWMTRINRVLAGLMIVAAGYYTVLLLKQVGVIKKPAAGISETARVTWYTDERAALAAARAGKRPVLVDFSAEWCTVCTEIDTLLFKDPRVEQKLREFVTLKIDVTRDTPQNSEILKRYGVLSLPAMVFIGRDGKIRDEPRVHGLISAEEFLAMLRTL